MTAIELIEKLERVNVSGIAEQAITETKDTMLSLNKEQMLEGKLSTGQEITPSYLDDPYFKSRESAQKYSDWKDKITPNPNRRSGTPNLYINGAFHRSITVEVKGKDIVFNSGYKDASRIQSKFTENIYGLNEDSREEYEPIHHELFKEKYTDQTGLNFSL